MNARASRGEAGTSPSSIRMRHFLHVPWPPQVESIAIPFQEAASKTVTPGGTRTDVPEGSKRRVTRAGSSAGDRVSMWSSTSVMPVRPPPAGERAIQFIAHSSRAKRRSAARQASTVGLLRASMIALVRPT